jgi:trehalose utilization protein
MMKLDPVAPNKYTFPIESQVLSANFGEYHMEQVGEQDDRYDVTKRHPNLDGTCDIYAIVETGGEYLVHTPEKIQQLRIHEGGEVVSIAIQYRKSSGIL